MKQCTFVALVLCTLAPQVLAQPRLPPPASRLPQTVEANPQVFLITIGEGEHYWEKFGHNALWFYQPSRGIDVAFNWGVFDFDSPGFLKKQLIGDTKYWVEGVQGEYMIDAYRSYDRSVVLQKLNLTPEQARKAYEYALWNTRDENKYYRYDYFRDNCSTRVRDVIDLAVGGAFKARTTTQRVPKTYRSETERLVDDMKLTQFGIDVALGEPSDRQLTVWEDMFVPSALREAARNTKIPGPNGAEVPLVIQEMTVYQSRTHGERMDTPRLAPGYFIVGVLIAAEFVLVAWFGERARGLDVLFRAEVVLWGFVTGLLGVVLLLAWLITQHVFWYRNENLFFLNPLSLWLCVLALLSIWRPRWTRQAAVVAAIVAMFTAIALIVKGLPGFTQDNLPLILMFLPANFAIAFGMWRRGRERPVAPVASVA